MYSARFLPLFYLYQFVPPLHIGLSSPGSLPVVSSCWGRTHYTLRGGGEEGRDRKLSTKYASQIPHHFNKAISEGNDSCNSNDKEKGNYFKSDIESCDKYISDNENNESDISDCSEKNVSDSIICNKLIVTVTIGIVTEVWISTAIQ